MTENILIEKVLEKGIVKNILELKKQMENICENCDKLKCECCDYCEGLKEDCECFCDHCDTYYCINEEWDGNLYCCISCGCNYCYDCKNSYEYKDMILCKCCIGDYFSINYEENFLIEGDGNGKILNTYKIYDRNNNIKIDCNDNLIEIGNENLIMDLSDSDFVIQLLTDIEYRI